jgi:hypothetical protein
MQYPGPVEAKWWLEQTTRGMEELVEPQGLRSTTKGHRKVPQWWRSVVSSLGITHSSLRSLEPIEEKP